MAMSHTCIITPPCEWICRIHSQKQVLQGQSKYVRLILIDADRLSCTKVLSMHTSTAWLEKDTFHQINTACSQNCITVKLGLNRRHLYLFTFYLFYMHVCTCLVPGVELRLSSLTIDNFAHFFPPDPIKASHDLRCSLKAFFICLGRYFSVSHDLNSRFFFLLK